MIAKDGEGATKLIEVVAEGAKSAEDAYKAVSAIAKSPLVKQPFSVRMQTGKNHNGCRLFRCGF